MHMIYCKFLIVVSFQAASSLKKLINFYFEGANIQKYWVYGWNLIIYHYENFTMLCTRTERADLAEYGGTSPDNAFILTLVISLCVRLPPHGSEHKKECLLYLHCLQPYFCASIMTIQTGPIANKDQRNIFSAQKSLAKLQTYYFYIHNIPIPQREAMVREVLRYLLFIRFTLKQTADILHAPSSTFFSSPPCLCLSHSPSVSLCPSKPYLILFPFLFLFYLQLVLKTPPFSILHSNPTSWHRVWTQTNYHDGSHEIQKISHQATK